MRGTYLEVTSASEPSEASAESVRITDLETAIEVDTLGGIIISSCDRGVALHVIDDAVRI